MDDERGGAPPSQPAVIHASLQVARRTLRRAEDLAARTERHISRMDILLAHIQRFWRRRVPRR